MFHPMKIPWYKSWIWNPIKFHWCPLTPTNIPLNYREIPWNPIVCFVKVWISDEASWVPGDAEGCKGETAAGGWSWRDGGGQSSTIAGGRWRKGGFCGFSEDFLRDLDHFCGDGLFFFFFNGIFKYDFLYETDGISPKKWREMGIFMMDVHWFFNKGSWMTSANRSTCSRNHQKKVFIQKRPGWWWLVTCDNSATTIDEMGLSLQGRDISRAWLLHGWLMLADAFRFRY